ncbi:MAG TPA: trypsin-like peptidase domain-containing protein, partial [Tepidisphaeraceae bacterium]|nr:trypsin-like peptidase domain-containing protein [Tepidisphaeraceae bacterium]
MTAPFNFSNPQGQPDYPTRPRRSGSPGLLLFLILLIGVLLGWLISRAIFNHENATVGAQPRTVAPRGDLGAEEKTNVQIFKQTSPSVVYINTTTEQVNWFSGDVTQVPLGTGSGFIWDKAGHIVTNFHVVKDAEALTVTFQGQKTFPAKVVGVEPRKDIAVLRIKAPASELKAIRVAAATETLEVGQKTVAIGNPFGL